MLYAAIDFERETIAYNVIFELVPSFDEQLYEAADGCAGV
jgi:hypothetical protein